MIKQNAHAAITGSAAADNDEVFGNIENAATVEAVNDALKAGVSALLEAQKQNALQVQSVKDLFTAAENAVNGAAAADGIADFAGLDALSRVEYDIFGHKVTGSLAQAVEAETQNAIAEVSAEFFGNYLEAEKSFGDIADADKTALDEAKADYEALGAQSDEKKALDALAQEHGYTDFGKELEDRLNKATFEGEKKGAKEQAEALLKECDGENVQQALDAAKQKIDNVPYNKHTDDATRADYLNGQRGELTAAVDDVKFAQAQQRVIEKGAAAQERIDSGNYNTEQKAELQGVADKLKTEVEAVQNSDAAQAALDALLADALADLDKVPCSAATTGGIKADKSAKGDGTGDYPEAHDENEVWGIVTNDGSMPGGIKLVIERAADGTVERIEEAIKAGKVTAAAGSEFGGEDLGGLIKGKAIYSTLDIYLLQNNAKFDNFTGKYTVKILLPAGMRATEGLQVVYVNDDGSVEVFRTTFEDDGKYLVFETSHFSQFIILGESGRSGFWWWWILLISVAALALVGVSLLLIFLKKKDDDADKKKEGDPA